MSSGSYFPRRIMQTQCCGNVPGLTTVLEGQMLVDGRAVRVRVGSKMG